MNTEKVDRIIFLLCSIFSIILWFGLLYFKSKSDDLEYKNQIYEVYFDVLSGKISAKFQSTNKFDCIEYEECKDCRE